MDVRGKGHQGINGVPREEEVKGDKLSRWIARSAKVSLTDGKMMVCRKEGRREEWFCCLWGLKAVSLNH